MLKEDFNNCLTSKNINLEEDSIKTLEIKINKSLIPSKKEIQMNKWLMVMEIAHK